MDPELQIMLLEQHDVFSTADARSLGYTGRAIARLVHAGHWHRLRRGWYTPRPTWEAADARGKHLLTARAVARPLGEQVVLTGTTGTAALGLELWQQPLDTISVVRLDGRSGGEEYGVRHYERPAEMGVPMRLDRDFVVAPPLWVASIAMLEAPSLVSAVVVADSVLHHELTDKERLEQLAEAWQRWPRSRRHRLAARLADKGGANGGESVGRVAVFWRHNVPAPETQYKVVGPDGQVAWTDWAWPGLGMLGEFDGKRKYQRDLRSDEDPGEVVWREKRREEWVTDATQTLMRRMVFADIFQPRRTAAYFQRGLELAQRRRVVA